MLQPQHLVCPGVFRLSWNLDSDELGLFQGRWPIPHGISVNSYFVQGDKGVLIDLFCAGGLDLEDYESELTEKGLTLESVDFLILTRWEKGLDKLVWELVERRGVQVFCTAETAGLLPGLKTTLVQKGAILDLGAGKALVFQEHPGVPSFSVLETKSQTLFSSLLYSGFGSLEDAAFDDELSGGEKTFFESEILRFAVSVFDHFPSEPTAFGSPRIVAPAHGVIWRGQPGEIVKFYEKLSRYFREGGEDEIAVIQGSPGEGGPWVERVIAGASSSKIGLHLFQLPDDHLSVLLAGALRCRGLLVGTGNGTREALEPILSAFAEKGMEAKRVLFLTPFPGLPEWRERVQGRLRWTLQEAPESEAGTNLEALEKAFQTGKAFALSLKTGR